MELNSRGSDAPPLQRWPLTGWRPTRATCPGRTTTGQDRRTHRGVDPSPLLLCCGLDESDICGRGARGDVGGAGLWLCKQPGVKERRPGSPEGAVVDRRRRGGEVAMGSGAGRMVRWAVKAGLVRGGSQRNGTRPGSRLRSPSPGAATGRSPTPGRAREPRDRRPETGRSDVRPGEGPGPVGKERLSGAARARATARRTDRAPPGAAAIGGRQRGEGCAGPCDWRR